MKHEFKPTQYYITYDFETLEEITNEEFGKGSIQNAILHPFMVSSCVKLPDKIITKNFCLSNSKSFIDDWIQFLFTSAKQVSQANKDMYQSLIEKLPDNLATTLQTLIDNEFNTIPVIGFNSGKFDINIFLKDLVQNNKQIQSLIGTTTKYKMVKVGMKQTKIKHSITKGYQIKIDNVWQSATKEDVLKIKEDEKANVNIKFIDILNFVAPCTLKQFVNNFGGNATKAPYPHQYINLHNWEQELRKSEQFEYEHFYSDLDQSNISEVEYQEYLNLYKNFNSRLEYQKYYCNNDVEIMIKPIDNLIHDTFKYKIDMLHNLSLASNASMIKYSMMYIDFIDEYDTNKIQELYDKRNNQTKVKRLNISEEYWKMKVDG
jgi:hypothetical protein